MALHCGFSQEKPLQIIGFGGFMFPLTKIPTKLNRTLLCHGLDDTLASWKMVK